MHDDDATMMMRRRRRMEDVSINDIFLAFDLELFKLFQTVHATYIFVLEI